MADGVRLATQVLRPAGAQRAPAVLIRTPYGSRMPRFSALLARLFAEAGFAVVLQDVRGRFLSEGRFDPFHAEAADGARTLDWIADQAWFGGRTGAIGFSYLAYTAWAARAAAPARVDAVAVGIGVADLHPMFYPGGAFSLETALRWSAGVGLREEVPERRLDLARGLRHRPLREADRVALRERPWFRDWLDHPRRDGFWQSLAAPLEDAPPTLSIAGWYDLFLAPQLAEYAALATGAGGPPPRLVVGPWAHGRYRHPRWAPRQRWFARVALEEMLAFLDRHLRDAGDLRARPVRVSPAEGGAPIDLAAWPPPDARPRVLYLRSGGGANTLAGDGRLDSAEAGRGEAPDRFTYDPADPVPSLGGAMLGPSGRADQRPVESREDVLCYTTGPLEAETLLAGPVRVVLHAASSAPDTDFTAKLVSVAPDGRSVNLCEGVARARWRHGGEAPRWLEPGVPEAFEIDLGAVVARLPAAHRLRLEVSSSSFPRFDANPNTRGPIPLAECGVAAQQTVHHEPDGPSRIELHTLG